MDLLNSIDQLESLRQVRVVRFILSFTFIVFPDFFDHFLISFDNKSSDISALFAVIDCTCIPTNLIVYVSVPADRTDFD